MYKLQFANYSRALIFTFPYNVIHLFRTIFVSLLLSIVLGVIYWHVRVGREQEHLWDRIGFYHSLLAIVPLPLLLITINDGKFNLVCCYFALLFVFLTSIKYLSVSITLFAAK